MQRGKQRSRLNSVRHGLTAETVIGSLEDPEDYKAFEAAVADHDAATAVARELVLRLASLLWRLRRGNAIEADLFEIQAEGLAPSKLVRPCGSAKHLSIMPSNRRSAIRTANGSNLTITSPSSKKCVRGFTHSFLRLGKNG
jgi:hypothetical protein